MALIRAFSVLIILAASADAAPLRARAAADASAALELGHLYDTGRGVPLDPGEALRWYRHAGALGSADGALNAGAILDLTTRRGEAVAWYARAALLGAPRAGFALGQLYAAGDGVPRNATLARAWFDIAAETVPRAATLRDALPAAYGTSDPIRPILGIRMGPRAVMVWTAGEGGADGGEGFAVALRDAAGRIVAEAETALSAVAVEAPTATAWRIERGREATRWMPLAQAETDLPDAVLIRTAPGDVPAGRLAARLREALERGGAAVRHDATGTDGADRTAVAVGWPGAAHLGEAVAEFLPSTAVPSSTVVSVELDHARSDVVVTLVGGPAQ